MTGSQATPPVAVITGASAGIGRACAVALAARGWRVIGVGRNPERSAAAQEAIQAASSGAGVDMLIADLSLMREANRVAEQIAALTDLVQVLLNNAGGMASELAMTDEGLERNFAGNHLGPFLLTARLLPLLHRAAADSPGGAVRIINTSSDGSEMIEGMPWDDIQGLNDPSPGKTYCLGKLANVLFARALAERLAGDGIIAHAVHPGTVDSNFISHVNEDTRAYMQTLEMISPEAAAEALLWLATAQEPGETNGGYYHQRTPQAPNPFVEQAGAPQRLWEESEKLVASVGFNI